MGHPGNTIHFSSAPLYCLQDAFGPVAYGINNNGLADTFIGGWSLSGIFTYQSGQPVNVPCTASHAAGIGCYSIVNRAAMFDNAHTLTHWLNAVAYSDPSNNATTLNIADFSPLGAHPAMASVRRSTAAM
ncbi:MAG TPA: hypothetical protein VMU57_16055 [Edaphobacter sp.]|uniref:hypothetical protein n=1 Tax=Edaphobacter sp. TaxID=1934404 RepID=UPI002C58E1E2|nr:hypothetical protein [Edaphobacter sp.]HUZ96418.1 hypothetical protein [Edaphobacter sp.]